MTPARIEWLPRTAQRMVAWQNGGGSTREVAIEPPGGSLIDGFVWRISIAAVASDGPFSRLSGIDRSLWLLRGRGMVLAVDGATIRLDRAFQRFDFAGEAAVSARLLGEPTEDLNVMVARAAASAESAVHRLDEGESFGVALSDAQHVLVALTGTLVVFGGVLAAGDAVRCDGAAKCEVLAADGAGAFLLASFVRR